MARRLLRGVRALLPFALVPILLSCEQTLLTPETTVTTEVLVSFAPIRNPNLLNTEAAERIHRVDITLRDAVSGEVLLEDQIWLDPDGTLPPLQLRLVLKEGESRSLEGTIELIHAPGGAGGVAGGMAADGGESVEWSARFGPVNVDPTTGEMTVDIPVGRGSLEALGATGVTATIPGGEVEEGAQITVQAQIQGDAGSASVFWGSDNPAIASVDQEGRVTTHLPGAVRITAAIGLHVTALELVVLQRVDRVDVTPSLHRLTALMDEATFAAQAVDPRGNPVSGRTIAWRSESPSVEHLGEGIFRALAPGTASIVAEVGGKTGSGSIDVVQEVVALAGLPEGPIQFTAFGETRALTADPVDRNGFPVPGATVQWNSSDDGVLTVDASGTVRAVGIGEAEIEAVSNAIRARVLGRVTQLPRTIRVSKETLAFKSLGATAQLTAFVVDSEGVQVPGVLLRWSSSDVEVVTVDQTGKVRAERVGSARLTVRIDTAPAQGETARSLETETPEVVVEVTVVQLPASLEITPSSIEAEAAGETTQLSVEVFDANENLIPDAEVEWSTSNDAVATVSETGLVTTTGAGNAIIKVLAGEVEGSVLVTVTIADTPTFTGDLHVFDGDDLADFAEAGWERIEGSLTIGGTGSPLTHLSGMESLREVSGSVHIVDNPSITDLTALIELQKIGGPLFVQRNPTLTVVPDFLHLSQLGGLHLSFNDALTQIGTFPGIEEVFGSISIARNASLSVIDDPFPALRDVGGAFLLTFGASVTAIRGFEALEMIDGTFQIGALPVLQELAPFSGLTSVGGTLAIGLIDSMEEIAFGPLLEYAGGFILIPSANLVEFSGLPSLVEVGIGGIFYQAHLLLESPGSFPSLVSVGGRLEFSGQPSLLSIPEFPLLESVSGEIRLVDNAKLAGISGFPVLEEIGGPLSIANNLLLAEVAGFGALRTVGTGIAPAPGGGAGLGEGLPHSVWTPGALPVTLPGSIPSHVSDAHEGGGGGLVPALSISRNPVLESIPQFESLERIGRSLMIEENPLLEAVEGFPSLEHVYDVLIIGRNEGLLEVSGFNALRQVGPTEGPGGGPDIQSLSPAFVGEPEGPQFPVPGDLWIVMNPSLISVDGFQALEEVGGGLWFAGNESLESVPGFPALERIELELLVTGSSSLPTLSGFPELTEIGAELAITDNDALTSVQGFGNLALVGMGTFGFEPGGGCDPCVIDLGSFGPGDSGLRSRLTSIEWGLFESQVEEPPPPPPGFRDLRIRNNEALTALPDFSRLNLIGGALLVEFNPALENFPGFPVLDRVKGNIIVRDNESLTTLAGFDMLGVVEGEVTVSSNAALAVISAFPALREIWGRLFVSNHNSLESLTGFEALEQVGGPGPGDGPLVSELPGGLEAADHEGALIGWLEISNNPMLEVIPTFASLVYVPGMLEIRHNALLQNVAGFGALQEVGGLRIHDNEALAGVSGFPELVESQGEFAIRWNGALTSLGGFGALESVGGLFEIRGMPSLTSLSGFGVIEAVGGSAIFGGLGQITSLAPFSNLASIGGSLQIIFNGALQDLDALSNLASTVQDLLIDSNQSLADISGLENIGTAAEANPAVLGDFTVTHNPALPQVEAEGLAEGLGVGGTTLISGNLVVAALPFVGNSYAGRVGETWAERQPRKLTSARLNASGASIFER